MDDLRSNQGSVQRGRLRGSVDTTVLQPIMLMLALTGALALAVVSVYGSFAIAVLLIFLLVMGWAAVHQPEIGLLAVIVVMPLETFNQSISLGPFSVVKLIGAGALAAYALHYLVVDRDKWLVNVPQNIYILLLLLAVVLSNLVAVDPQYAIDKTFKLGRMVVFYFLVINVVRTRSILEHVLWAMVIAGFFATFYGFWQYTFAPETLDEMRIQGPYDDSMAYSYSMVVILPMIWYLLTRHTRPLTRFFLATAGLLMMYGVLLSGTRSGILAMVGVVALIALRKRRNMLVNLVILCVLVAAAWLLLPEQVKTRLGLTSETSKAAQQSTERRLSYATFGLEIFLENPFLGTGLGGFASEYGQSIYRFWRNPDDPRRIAHNMYLEIAVGLGLLGLIPFLLLLFSCLVGLQRLVDYRWHKAYAELAVALQTGLLAYMFIGLFSSSQYDKALWLLIGLAAVLPVLADKDERQAALAGQASILEAA